MATGTGAWYGKAIQACLNGDLDLGAGTFKFALAATAYTPDVDTHDFWDDVSANEVTGTNWAAGGQTVTVAVAQDAGNNRIYVTVSDISVATVTLSDAKHGILYKSTGVAGTSNLIGYVTFDTALAPSAGTLAIDFDDTNGFLRVTY